MKMIPQSDCVFEIIKVSGILYEIAKSAGGPAAKLYGKAIETFNQFGLNLDTDTYEGESAAALADEFLEWIFNDGPKPGWCEDLA